jgi:hypothetical protein
MKIVEFISQPWPWYVSGFMIAFIMLLLLYEGKSFGMSANLRTMCSIGGAGKWADFFRFDWKSQKWNLLVVLGSIVGGFIATQFLTPDQTIALNPKTIDALKEMGFNNPGASYLPPSLFSWGLIDTQGLLILVSGGFLVGFGARYAGGCTSGHAISGLSDLQLPSLIAVVGFFIGGIIMTHFFMPLIF